MNKTVLLVAGYLVFLWVALSGALAHEEQDFLQPEIDVKIGNEFSNISDLVLHSLRAKNNEKSVSGINFSKTTLENHANMQHYEKHANGMQGTTSTHRK